jgi:hypothetical protein
MRTSLLAALLGTSLAACLPASAREVDTVRLLVPAIQAQAGVPIAVLDRYDNAPDEFWYQAMKKFCEVTGDNWCDDELTIIQDTTNQLGWTRKFQYKGDDGSTKEVCAVLPPRPGITAGYVASALYGSALSSSKIPSNESSETWLFLMHLATCGSTGAANDEKQADAFATTALALIEGDPGFVAGTSISDARFFAAYRNTTSNRWAVNVAERILLDLWKNEAAAELRAQSCRVSVTASTDLNTDYIDRQGSLPDDGDCTSEPSRGSFVASGNVTDSNLWLWTSGRPGSSSPRTGLPPQAYTPFKSFADYSAAVTYMWKTSVSLSGQ